MAQSDKPLLVKQQQGAEKIPTEILAQSIKEIADSMKKIRAGRLNSKALVLLISESSGVSRGAVKRVLESLESLERTYLK